MEYDSSDDTGNNMDQVCSYTAYLRPLLRHGTRVCFLTRGKKDVKTARAHRNERFLTADAGGLNLLLHEMMMNRKIKGVLYGLYGKYFGDGHLYCHVRLFQRDRNGIFVFK